MGVAERGNGLREKGLGRLYVIDELVVVPFTVKVQVQTARFDMSCYEQYLRA